jgi:hypothetical protein
MGNNSYSQNLLLNNAMQSYIGTQVIVHNAMYDGTATIQATVAVYGHIQFPN